jgi:hypothetical protein
MPRLEMNYPYGRRTDPRQLKDLGILQPVMRFVKHIIFALKDLPAGNVCSHRMQVTKG